MQFNRTLKIGDNGDDVKNLQQKLIDYGYSTCFVQENKVGTLTVDGEFGIITQETLNSFQAKIIDGLTQEFVDTYVPVEYRHEFVVNGEMDFAVYYVLENFESLKLWYKTEIEKPTPIEEPPVEEQPESMIDTVIRLANKEIGTMESGGNNYGTRVQEYQRIGSSGEVDGGSPYCAYFFIC